MAVCRHPNKPQKSKNSRKKMRLCNSGRCSEWLAGLMTQERLFQIGAHSAVMGVASRGMRHGGEHNWSPPVHNYIQH